MPQAIVALVAAVVSIVTANAAVAFVVKSVIAYGLSVLAQSLRKKPKQNGSFRDQGSTFMVRQSAYPRRMCYGRSRVGGIWAYANTTGSANKYLHLVLVIGEGPIQEVEEIYFGDELIVVDANGDVTSPTKYVGKARLIEHLGDQLTADTTLIAEDDNWTSDHKGLGIAYMYCRFEHSTEVWEAGLPEVSFVVKGRSDIEDLRTLETAYTANMALCWRHYMMTANTGPLIPEENIDANFCEIAADICDEGIDVPDTAEATIIPAIPTNLTDAAALFAGAANGLYSAAASINLPQDEFSFSIWYYVTGTGVEDVMSWWDTADRAFLFAQREDHAPDDVEFYYQNSGFTATHMTHGNSLNNQLNHAVVTYSYATDSLVTLNVNNGTRVTSVPSGVMDTTAADFMIGDRDDASGVAMSGYVQCVALYDKVLTTSEEADLYNSGTPLPLAGMTGSIGEDLLHFWHLNEGSGTRADSVGGATLTDGGTILFTNGTVEYEATAGAEVTRVDAGVEVTQYNYSQSVRYEVNGNFLLDLEPEEIAGDLVEAGAGWQVFSGGRFRLYAGAYTEPSFHITEDMIVDTVTMNHKTPRTDRVNRVKGVYRDPVNQWQPTDFPSVSNTDYLLTDGEEHIVDKELPFTITGETAQRLAKIDLERGRKMKKVRLTCNMRAFAVQAGENIKLSISYLGFVEKPFYVDTVSLGVVDDMPGLVFDLTENGPDVYAWDPLLDNQATNTANEISVGGPTVDLTIDPGTPGPVNPAALFEDGVGQRLEVADSANFDYSSGSFTIAVWVRDDGSSDAWATAFAQADSAIGAGSTFALMTRNATVQRANVSLRDGAGTVWNAEVATTLPNDEWVLLVLRYDGTDTMSLWAESADSSYAVATTAGPLVSGVANGTLDLTVGTADDTTSSLIGAVGAIAIWSTEVSDAFLDTYKAGGIGYSMAYSELSAGQLTSLDHYFPMTELTGIRENAEGVEDFADAGTTGTGATKGGINWPLSVALTSTSLNARIFWSVLSSRDSISTSDLSGPDADLTESGTASVAESEKLIARAFEDPSESPNQAGYYGFDYDVLAYSGDVVLHLDAKFGISLDGSGNVEHWRDEWGSDNDAFQTTSGERPGYTTDGGNGYPAVVFDGVDDNMLIPQLMTGQQSRSVYLVFKSSGVSGAAQNENVIFDMQDGASPASGAMWAIGLERQLRVIGSSTHYQTFNTTIGAGFTLVHVHWNDGSSHAISDDTDTFVAGDNRSVVATNDVTLNTATTTNSVLGKSNALAGSEFTGNLCEMMVMDHYLAAGERQQVAKYFKFKYGL